jgi:replicative DNA helicase
MNGVDSIRRHDLDSEKAVLGIGLLFAEHLVAIRESNVREAFYHPSHSVILDAMLAVADRGEAVDIVTVAAELRARERLSTVGGPQYLGELTDRIPSVAHLDSYIATVTRYAQMRRLGALGLELAARAESDPEPGEAIADASKRLAEIGDATSTGKPVSLGDAIGIVFEEIERVCETGIAPGILSGYTAIDGLLAGFRPGQFVLLAARPKMGKTQLALSVALKIAKAGKRVLIFAMEMRKEELAQRVLCAEAGVDADRVRRGNLEPDHFTKLAAAAQRLHTLPVWIDDAPRQKVSTIRSKTRRHAADHGVDFVVVDYLGLMSPEEQSDNAYREVSEISRNMKIAARELGVPMLVLAQLNRGPDNRPNHRPEPKDLRDSGTLEQDADAVTFLYREEVYDKDTPDRGIAEFIVAYQRSGPTGTGRLRFVGSTMQFADVDAPENDAAPAYDAPRYHDAAE